MFSSSTNKEKQDPHNMRVLTKTFLPKIDNAIKIFFSTLVPQALRLLVLLVCVTWKYCITINSHNKFISIIDERTRIYVYRRSSELLKSTESCECAVCLSEIRNGEKVRELECKHVFHRKCVDRWLSYGGAATCPVCRRVVLPRDVAEELKRQQEEQDEFGFEKELALMLLSTLHQRRCNDFS